MNNKSEYLKYIFYFIYSGQVLRNIILLAALLSAPITTFLITGKSLAVWLALIVYIVLHFISFAVISIIKYPDYVKRNQR